MIAGKGLLKRRTILDAARGVFLDKGYAGASMDEVAAVAGASKVTVYRYFADKQRLFASVVADAIEQAEAGTQDLVDRLAVSDDVEADLRAFARRHVADVTRPHLVRMRRLLIAEATRFPELAATWHRAAPERAHATLAAVIARLAGRGLLHAPDPLLAAQNLNYLILSVPLNEAMFTGADPAADPERLTRYADEAVRVFMAAYGPAS
jgi:TetR/AcrR family transcriptional regulator, mexJK operon transcriptional repressor